MAFDDLTPNQRDTLIQLIEALNKGGYNDEFAMGRRAMQQRGFIFLFSNSDSSTLEIEGFTDSDIQAVKDEGYITLGPGGKATLKPKAHQQYKLHKDPLDLFSPSELARGQGRAGKPLSERIDNPMAPAVQDPRNVFVVHGRNLEARNSLFRFLRSIGLKPLEWSQAVKATGEASPFIGNILDVAFSMAQAIVVLLTPDDEARLREQFRGPADPPYESQLTGQARPNVLFEAGMAMGHNPNRTIIVELGTVRPFSDIAGRHTVRLSNASAARQELAQRLETAGCAVDLSGRDWHTEGDFTNTEPGGIVAGRDIITSHVIIGSPATNPSVPVGTPSVEDEYDENDVISMLAAWLRSKNIEYQGYLVTYADVDRDLGLRPGTAKTHLKAAVSDLGLFIEREGKNTITLRRRVSIA